MKKIILLGIVLLLIPLVTATYWCGDGICETEYCPADCDIFLSTYCGDLIEPYECDDICGTELGWIRPFDCEDYGYTPTEDCAECPICPECEADIDCTDTGCTFTSRDGLETFCESYDFIRAEDCPDCPACTSGEGYEDCDSCCPESSGTSGTYDGDCPFQWWLLIIGGLVGYFTKRGKKK